MLLFYIILENKSLQFPFLLPLTVVAFEILSDDYSKVREYQYSVCRSLARHIEKQVPAAHHYHGQKLYFQLVYSINRSMMQIDFCFNRRHKEKRQENMKLSYLASSVFVHS